MSSLNHGRFHLNLVSLTDIVTNCIGMLVLFAVLTLLAGSERTHRERVPLSYETKLSPVIFLCQADALVRLEPSALGNQIVNQVFATQPDSNGRYDLGYAGLNFALNDQSGVVSLYPGDLETWDGVDAISRNGSAIKKALDALDAKREFAFFFVRDEPLASGEGSGYRAFQHARDYLLKRKQPIKSGWLPYDDAHPPFLCAWGENLECRLRPAFRPAPQQERTP